MKKVRGLTSYATDYARPILKYALLKGYWVTNRRKEVECLKITNSRYRQICNCKQTQISENDSIIEEPLGYSRYQCTKQRQATGIQRAQYYVFSILPSNEPALMLFICSPIIGEDLSSSQGRRGFWDTMLGLKD